MEGASAAGALGRCLLLHGGTRVSDAWLEALGCLGRNMCLIMSEIVANSSVCQVSE